MKKILILLIGLFFICNQLEAVPTAPKAPKEQISASKELAKDQKQTVKKARKQARQEKKLQKLEKKLKKKGMDKGGELWNDDTFRLGALIALGGLALRLLGFIPLLGGIINLIGTLLLLLGIGIMIWVLLK